MLWHFATIYRITFSAYGCVWGMSLSLCPPLSPTVSRQMDGRGPGRFEVAWECHGPKNVTSTTQLLK